MVSNGCIRNQFISAMTHTFVVSVLVRRNCYYTVRGGTLFAFNAGSADFEIACFTATF